MSEATHSENPLKSFDYFTGTMCLLALFMALLVSFLLNFQTEVLHYGDVIWNWLDRWITIL